MITKGLFFVAFYDTNNNGFYMPVAPAYAGNYGNGGGFGFGGDGAWWLLLLVLLGGGMWSGLGMGGFGGMMGAGMMGMDFLYPWLNNSEHISGGFRDQMLQSTVNSLGDKITNGFGNTSTQLCNGFAGVTAAITGAQNAVSQQLYTNQIADLERSYAAQTASTQGMTALQGQLAQCCCDNRLATVQTQGVVQTEAAATRASASADTQKILDKLCQLELDGVRSDLEAERRSNIELQNRLNMANLAASQAAQTATFQQGMNAEVDALYNRLSNCPVPSVPVYGRQPIFTCGGNTCGCGCGAN